MTTINPMSTVGTTAVIMPSDLNDGWTYVASAGHYKTPDLLAALDAVPAAALAGSEDCRLATEKNLAEAETEVEAWKHTVSVLDDELRDAQELLGQRAVELHKARAERDALAKTVERVREALSRHPEPCAETEFTCGWKGAVVDLRAALDPQPALPTETGSVIIATFDCIDTIYTKPIRRLRNGGWSTLDEKQIFMDSDCIKEWKPAKVVEA